MHKPIYLGNYSISQVAGYLHCFTPRRWNSEKKVGLGGYTRAPEKALHKRALSSLKMKNSFLDSRNAKTLRKNVFESPENQTPIQPIEAICPRTGRSYVAAVAWGGSFPVGRTKCHGETLSLDGQGLKLWILPVLCNKRWCLVWPKLCPSSTVLPAAGPAQGSRSKVGSVEARLGNLVNLVNPIGAFPTAQRIWPAGPYLGVRSGDITFLNWLHPVSSSLRNWPTDCL